MSATQAQSKYINFMKSYRESCFCLKVIIFIFCFLHAAAQFEREPCKIGKQSGLCLKIVDCEPAKQSLIKYGSHNFERCGFVDAHEIVCCPNLDRNNDKIRLREPTIKKKSEQVCDEFSKTIADRVTYQIYGGENAEPGEFPHMAALGYEDIVNDVIMWNCGGSLISHQYVLTAAHCIKTRFGQPVKVRLGKLDLIGTSDNLTAQDFNILKFFVYPKYIRSTKGDDIALIQLSKPIVRNNYVHPACLYTKEDDPVGLIITGWGHVSADETVSLNALQKALIHPVKTSNCNETFIKALQNKISPLQICAKSSDGTRDTCKGDSGGPLQVQQSIDNDIYSIVGITSYGIGCGGSTPGVYTRVSSYVDWIEGIVWPSRT